MCSVRLLRSSGSSHASVKLVALLLLLSRCSGMELIFAGGTPVDMTPVFQEPKEPHFI